MIYNTYKKGEEEMQLTMSAFSSLTKEEMTVVDGDGWVEFGQVLAGTLFIALAPAVGAATGLVSPVGGVSTTVEWLVQAVA